MSDLLVDLSLLITPVVVVVVLFVVYQLVLRSRERQAQPSPVPKPKRAGPSPRKEEPKSPSGGEENVDEVLSELDDMSQKVLGESVLEKER